MAESCTHSQMALLSPDAARAARSPGFCGCPARGCVGRRGRPLVAHGQRLPCPCSGPSWLQLASAGRRPCGGPPAGGGDVAAPSRLSPLQSEQDVPAGHPPAVGAPVRRAGSRVRSRSRREACCCTPGPAPADGRATWASAPEAAYAADSALSG